MAQMDIYDFIEGREEGFVSQFYYEFKDHDYYALIAVHLEYKETISPARKAAEIYVESVGGESADAILLFEGFPTRISKEEAFYKFAQDPEFGHVTLREAVEEFDSAKNDVLLIDGALI